MTTQWDNRIMELPECRRVERTGPAIREEVDAAQDAYDRSPQVQEVVERGLVAPPEDMHPRPLRRAPK